MTGHSEEDAQLLPLEEEEQGRNSDESVSSTSTTSLVFERIGKRAEAEAMKPMNGNKKTVTPKYPPRDDSLPYRDDDHAQISLEDEEKETDLETGPFLGDGSGKAVDKKFRRLLWIIGGVFIGAWVTALVLFLFSQTYKHSSTTPHDPAATASRGNGKKVTLDQVMAGQWRANRQGISWIDGANGEDGLLLERGVGGKDYLVVEDIRGSDASNSGTVLATKTLMKDAYFKVGGRGLTPSQVFPSKDLKKVLIATDILSNWRHSFYAKYWIFDVETQTAEPLDSNNLDGRVQLASWSPQSDAIVFTRDNNMFLRKLSTQTVIQITTDGGTNLFYGAPDWVYEEEVFGGNSATWWADDGKFIAFLRTNETEVPEYPIQYFVSRPSGVQPRPGEESYPEVREIKYPKAGAPNPIVDLQFFDIAKGDVFEVKIADGFEPENLLITEVVWAGSTGKALIRETNRESDILRVVLVDVEKRTGKTVRTEDIQKLDSGWFEVSENTRYIPADPANGRPQDGYIDTVIYENYDHLGYFTPMDNPNPIMLTSGKWEVVDAPSAVDLKNNLVYFTSTKVTRF
jgi:dipeptidyl aminopeptidase